MKRVVISALIGHIIGLYLVWLGGTFELGFNLAYWSGGGLVLGGIAGGISEI